MKSIRSALKRSEVLVRIIRRLRIWSLKRKRRRHFQAYIESSPERKLQLGSGSNNLAGWLNTDSHLVRSNSAYLDITEPLPFDGNVFHYLFCEHTIEHVHFNQTRALLSECYRVLLPGGKIRLATPDLEAYLKLYRGGNDPILQDCLAGIFNSWILPGFYEAVNYRPVNNDPSALFVINDLFRNYEHKFIYDYETLALLLKQAGFQDISRSSASVSSDVQLRRLETHNDRIYGFLTLVVEGRKETQTG